MTSVLVGVAFSSFLLFPLYIISDDEGIGINDAVRLFGIGGVFGFIGWFRLKGVGIFRSYITDEKKAFLIYRKNGVPIDVVIAT